MARWHRVASLLLVLGVLCLAGCASTRPRPVGERPFQFERDTFAYANELLWDYAFDDAGHWRGRAREPRPDYTHRCFVVVRSARQFFQHARFDPALPKAGPEEYRRLVRRVVSTSPRKDLSESSKVVIPGYANLREFSRDAERVLKEECGSFWESYFQRGHWRMILPFSRAHQRDMADQLMSVLRQNRPPVVHVACFPSLRINHGLLLFAFEETESQIRFAAYDPNYPEQPTALTFRRDTSRFELPGNTYFPGGRVSAYEVYCGPCY